MGIYNLALTKENSRVEDELALVQQELQRDAELAKESVSLLKENFILAKI